MKKLFLIILLIFSVSVSGQTINGDDPKDVIAFAEGLNDFSVKKKDETDRQYTERIESFIKTTQFKNKPLAETVLIIQDGINYSGKYFDADFNNRKLGDITLYLKGLDNERLLMSADRPYFYIAPDKAQSIKTDVRLAVYGFPLGVEKRYKGLYFMPLKYVFFNGATGEILAARHASNNFAKYISKDIPLPEVKVEPKPVSITPPVKKTINTSVQFIGDSSVKLFYPLACSEIFDIKDVDRITFLSREEADDKGFKLSSKCTPPKPISRNDSQSNAPREKPFKLGSTKRAYNILAVLTYPESWVNRKIIIEGWIELGRLPSTSEFNNRQYQSFVLRDESESITLVAPESKITGILRDKIIRNNGKPIEGTFTFILYEKVYTNIGRIGSLQSYTIY
jgi:hypothetical protein